MHLKAVETCARCLITGIEETKAIRIDIYSAVFKLSHCVKKQRTKVYD
jgi:hypothetical protein